MTRALGILLLLVGCSPPLAEDSSSTDDTDTSPPIDTAPLADRFGTVPSSPVPAPEFSALNFDETSRTSADLMGHPTVIWFYPKAATAF